MLHLIGNLIVLGVAVLYLVAAWKMRPWGPRWQAARAAFATAEKPLSRLGRGVAWLILWVLFVPIFQDEFFDHVAGDDEAEGIC